MNPLVAVTTITAFGGKVNADAKQIRIKQPLNTCPQDVQNAVHYLQNFHDHAFDNSADKTCAICTEEIAFGEFVCVTCKLLDEN